MFWFQSSLGANMSFGSSGEAQALSAVMPWLPASILWQPESKRSCFVKQPEELAKQAGCSPLPKAPMLGATSQEVTRIASLCRSPISRPWGTVRAILAWEGQGHFRWLSSKTLMLWVFPKISVLFYRWGSWSTKRNQPGPAHTSGWQSQVIP